ncbi:hypothetical protein CHS0354_007466, partial [Potamilus streckersoni]
MNGSLHIRSFNLRKYPLMLQKVIKEGVADERLLTGMLRQRCENIFMQEVADEIRAVESDHCPW